VKEKETKWGRQDSNLCRHKSADLQSAPIGRSGTPPNVSFAFCSSNAALALRLPAGFSEAHFGGQREKMQANAVVVTAVGGKKSWRRELNPQPTVYKTVALPLSYAS
jgi:hypothetical protein